MRTSAPMVNIEVLESQPKAPASSIPKGKPLVIFIW